MKTKVVEVDLKRNRIALTMRLNEKIDTPSESQKNSKAEPLKNKYQKKIAHQTPPDDDTSLRSGNIISFSIVFLSL